uniref:RRM domain-containing protein n=1 Tax=Kalanchoe fedtschenkoi TaxID=63787 RepID=A0A7N0UTX9_KALFE
MSVSSLSAAPQVHTACPSFSSYTSTHFKFSALSFHSSATPHFQLKFPLKSANPNPLRSPFGFSPASAATEDFVQSGAFPYEEEEELVERVSESEYETESEDRKASQSQSRELGRLYVGNLPYSMTGDQLKEVFGEAGRVASVEIVYDRVTDRSRGFGFVTMATVDDAKEAIRMYDGAQIGGRTVKVNFPEVPRGGEREVMGPKIRNSYKGFVDSPHKVYAGNLSWDLTSQQLREIFADQPGLLGAKVIYDRDTGRSRGFGFVTFASAEQVQAALDALNGKEIEGRPLRLNKASERARPVDSENRLDSNELFSSVNS